MKLSSVKKAKNLKKFIQNWKEKALSLKKILQDSCQLYKHSSKILDFVSLSETNYWEILDLNNRLDSFMIWIFYDKLCLKFTEQVLFWMLFEFISFMYLVLSFKFLLFVFNLLQFVIYFHLLQKNVITKAKFILKNVMFILSMIFYLYKTLFKFNSIITKTLK